jgi:hypothetical protein
MYRSPVDLKSKKNDRGKESLACMGPFRERWALPIKIPIIDNNYN